MYFGRHQLGFCTPRINGACQAGSLPCKPKLPHRRVNSTANASNASNGTLNKGAHGTGDTGGTNSTNGTNGTNASNLTQGEFLIETEREPSSTAASAPSESAGAGRAAHEWGPLGGGGG